MILKDDQVGDTIFGCDDCGEAVYYSGAIGSLPQLTGWLIKSSIQLCRACARKAQADFDELEAMAKARGLLDWLIARRQARKPAAPATEAPCR